MYIFRVYGRQFILVMALAILLHSPAIAEQITVVTLPKPKNALDSRYLYDRELLAMALEETRATHGAYAIKDAPMVMSHKRIHQEVAVGRIVNVMRSPTNADLETRLIPIRIPIFMGLLGYRVLIIRNSDQARFDSIRTLADLRKLRAGQGTGWVDIPILEGNGLRVAAGTNYNGLFGMLAAGRFDYFPRGVNEILPELASQKASHPSLAAEQHLLLHYPFPVYFFVTKSDPKLAERLAIGLKRLAETNQIRDLLFRYFGSQINELKLGSRRILRLENPYLPTATPLSSDQFWLDPLEMQAKENPVQG